MGNESTTSKRQILSKSNLRYAITFIFAIALATLPMLNFPQTSYWVRVVGYTGLYIILGLGLNVVVGFAGLLDLGYVAFYAIGAYTFALLAGGHFDIHLSFWLIIPIAGLLASLAGILLGLPVLKMRGDYLAIVTLGFGEIIRLLATNLTGFTNGSQGLYNLDKPSLFGFILKSGTNFYYLIFVLVLIIFFVVNRLDRSRIGRAWIAIREDEDVAQMMGVNTTFYKLLAFAIGALIGGLGGSVFAAWQGSIFPDNFNLFVSINVLCLIIIGGMGSIPGVIIGSFALIALPDILREFATYRLLIFGLLLVIMMIARPEGFIPSRRRQLELHSKSNGDQTISSDIPGEEA
ncbi:MAG TPA: branched-chain amino acid ABC transporter permease [Anaerolineales bacterium]|nr:branched-chain amino acid ABC transporter permease [Anaerolineales bacterium]